jgi:hypothetical protein
MTAGRPPRQLPGSRPTRADGPERRHGRFVNFLTSHLVSPGATHLIRVPSGGLGAHNTRMGIPETWDGLTGETSDLVRAVASAG